MITFKEFLLEDSRDIQQILLEDCRPFLEQADGAFLYRGIKEPKGTEKVAAIPEKFQDFEDERIRYFVQTPRTDRLPKDTSPELHKKLDDWFKKNFGWKARSEAVFTYGKKSWDDIKGYGQPYIVFPVGEFKLLWSNDIEDLFGWIGTRRSSFDINLLNDRYSAEDLKAAANSDSEIMIKCSRYYAIPYSIRTQFVLTQML